MNTGFDFSDFINDLRNNEEKKQMMESYESYFGPIGPDITKQIWYTEYVKGFEKFYPKEGIRVPEDLKQDFDWQLLFVLIVSSFSCEYRLEKPEENSNEGWRLLIKVTLNNDSEEESRNIEKSLDELWSFQIYRLYEIYTEEQISLQLEHAKDEDEWEAINNVRFEKIKKSLKIQKKRDKNDELVYHYTSISTFTELLKTNTLRASDLRFLNDKTEKIKWFNVFNKASDEVRRRISSKPNSEQLKEFLEKIGENINHYRSTECYIFCLSRLPDDKSQFQDYGDKSRGVSIGFNCESLIETLFEFNNIKDSEFVDGFLYGDVDYNEQALRVELIEKIDNLLEKCESFGKKTHEFFDSVSNMSSFNESCKKIFMRCQDAKDIKFQNEKEYRLYWMQESNNRYKKVGFFSRNNRIIPYIDLEFGNKSLPISEVIVGPDNKDEVVDNIKEVLKIMGYSNVNVKKSEIPYIS